MIPNTRYLTLSQAAFRLGVSPKALRLYEERGLIVPDRTPAGWRAYSAVSMARAKEVVSLRALGLSMAQVARVLGGDHRDLDAGLAAHETRLVEKAQHIAHLLDEVRRLRNEVATGQSPPLGDLARAGAHPAHPSVIFDLPWPWSGETFEISEVPSLTYITGPLGSGKSRLARRIADTIPGSKFLGLERMAQGVVCPRPPDGSAHRARVDQAVDWLIEEGARFSDPLVALVAAVEDDGPKALVVDMVEQDLDHATQVALMAYLRRGLPRNRPVFLLTRSSSILDPDSLGRDEAMILCPANHDNPTLVTPLRGAPGYEALATCLATPEVRARTARTIPQLDRPDLTAIAPA